MNMSFDYWFYRILEIGQQGIELEEELMLVGNGTDVIMGGASILIALLSSDVQQKTKLVGQNYRIQIENKPLQIYE